jgi:hypothetical protein
MATSSRNVSGKVHVSKARRRKEKTKQDVSRVSQKITKTNYTTTKPGTTPGLVGTTPKKLAQQKRITETGNRTENKPLRSEENEQHLHVTHVNFYSEDHFHDLTESR